jgi:TolB-like protein
VQFEVGDAVRSTNSEKPVAVLPFADENGESTRGAVALSEQLIGELVRQGIPTVERTRLVEVLRELALQNTGLVDAKSQQQIGKQLGAVALITGSVIPTARGRRDQVTVRMTDVQSGAVLYGSTFQASSIDRRHTTSGAFGAKLKAANDPLPAQGAENMSGDGVELPTHFVNQTYHTTVRRLKDGRWEEADSRTGHVNTVYTETSRTKETVELHCPRRNIEVRLLRSRMEQKINGKWQGVADGHLDSH